MSRWSKFTGGQRIDLLGIKKEDLPDVWKDLDMPSGHAYGKSFRTCKTCVGTDFCRYGVGDSTALGIKIEKRFQGIESPGKMKLATAGCPRNCSEAMVKDLGAVAVEGGKWEIYVGGAAGAHIRKGDILCVVDTHDDVLQIMGRFMQYYLENAKYLERTYGFVERVGMDKIRAIVVEDSEGIAARLDAAIQATRGRLCRPLAGSRHKRNCQPVRFHSAGLARINAMTIHHTDEITLGPVAQIPLGEGRKFQIGDNEIAVFHTRRASMRHRRNVPTGRGRWPTDWWAAHRSSVPFHAWKFDLTTGEELTGDCPLRNVPDSFDRERRNAAGGITSEPALKVPVYPKSKKSLRD